MKPYHKIPTVFKRDPATNYKTLLNEFATPELEYLQDCEWIFTEKVDGTNIRIQTFSNGEVAFRGRTDKANMPAKLVNYLCDSFPPHKKLHEQFPDGACLYGEGFGAGIQKGGGNYQATQEFVLFDIVIGGWQINQEVIRTIARTLGIQVVPIIGKGNLFTMEKIVNGGFASTYGNFQAEGIVARPAAELLDRKDNRIICKLKCRDFLS